MEKYRCLWGNGRTGVLCPGKFGLPRCAVSRVRGSDLAVLPSGDPQFVCCLLTPKTGKSACIPDGPGSRTSWFWDLSSANKKDWGTSTLPLSLPCESDVPKMSDDFVRPMGRIMHSTCQKQSYLNISERPNNFNQSYILEHFTNLSMQFSFALYFS